MELITMSNEELSRLEIIQKVILREFKQDLASELLNISTRQIRRLAENYKQYGIQGLISRKRDKPSNNQLSGKIKDEIISLIGSKYKDFGPTLAWEKITELHHINVSVETVRKLMLKAGLWIPRNQIIKQLISHVTGVIAMGSSCRLMVLYITGLRSELLNVIY